MPRTTRRAEVEAAEAPAETPASSAERPASRAAAKGSRRKEKSKSGPKSEAGDSADAAVEEVQEGSSKCKKSGKRKAPEEPEPEFDKDSCPICLEPLAGKAMFTTECGHQYHFKCIKQSIENGPNESCPLCRKSFHTMTPPVSLMKRGPLRRMEQPAVRIPRNFQSRIPPGPSTAAPRAVINEWYFEWSSKKIHGVTANITQEYIERVEGAAENGMIQTSPIVFAQGRLVTTYSGSVYRLGEIEPGFRASLGTPYDPENPLAGVDLFAIEDEINLYVQQQEDE
eukprot:tig00020801_g13916.t2